MKCAYLYPTLIALLVGGRLSAQPALEKKLQEQFILAEDGSTITIEAGTFDMTRSLWLDGKKNVTIRGAGKDKTILNFAGQREGAEGIKITNAENITLEGLSVYDTKGDAVKSQEVNGMTYRDVRTAWTGKPKGKNGAYGLYPVQCTNVLIENCEARGASDAGIYVGQSDQVIVRNSLAHYNVAGIEIENTTNAEVYDNVSTMNTGGILVFDLPGLIKKKGGHVRVYRNTIKTNNYKNFAPKGNIVGTVPPGTGVMILATQQVEIFDNQIIENKTVGTGIISYYITEIPISDKDYNPYPGSIYLHDNVYRRKKQMPTLKNKMGVLFFMKFGRKVPDILYDGIANKAWQDASGRMFDQYRICINQNKGATFANLDAANGFKHISKDTAGHECYQPVLSMRYYPQH